MVVKEYDLENNTKELQFVVSPSEMEKFLNNAAERLAKGMRVKGFRDGKVPRAVVESTLGRERVWQEAASEAIEEYFVQAMQERKIEPAGRPRVEITKLVPGNDLEFKATVPLLPEINLPDYKTIAKRIYTKESRSTEVKKADIDTVLKELQKSRTSARKKDGEGTDKNSEAEEAPELNDEFARSLGRFENLEELRSSIREGLKQEREQKEKDRLRLRTLEEIGKETHLVLSDLLITNELDTMQNEFLHQLDSMGMTAEKYLGEAKKTWEEVREGWRDKARERVQAALLLGKIAEQEKIEVDEKVVEEEANKYLHQFGSVEEAKKKVDPAALRVHIRGILRNEKVFQLLEEAEKEKSKSEKGKTTPNSEAKIATEPAE